MRKLVTATIVILLVSFKYGHTDNTKLYLCETTTDPKEFIQFYDSIKKDNINIPKHYIESETYNVISDIDTEIPEGKGSDIYDFAIIIGNKNYKFIPKIDYAYNDLRVVKKYVKTVFGIDEKNIIEFKDATKGNFELLFGTKDNYKGKIYRWTKEGKSRILFYYVGHGAPDIKTGNSYIVPVDADPHYITTSGYPTQLLFSNLSKLKYKKIIVIIDACFSGITPSGMLIKDVSPALLRVKKNTFHLENGSIFTSSRSNQMSTWYNEKGHSLFTYFFLKGIKGAADINNDNVVNNREINTYLKDNVSFTANRLDIEQDPQFFGDADDLLVEFK